MLNIKGPSFKLIRWFLFAPFIWWVYLIFADKLGAQPAQKMNHLTGSWALYYFIANLWIGILIDFKFRWPSLISFVPRLRRWLGVINYTFVLVHVFFYFALEGFEPKAFTQILTKRYLQFGILAGIVLTLLALTSNDYAVKKMGPKRWKRFHRLVYLCTLFVTLHIFLIEKADLVLFAFLTIPVWTLQTIRYVRHRKKNWTPASGDGLLR
jgi:sulfoxide reductase heme-binding subunit YedZ